MEGWGREGRKEKPEAGTEGERIKEGRQLGDERRVTNSMASAMALQGWVCLGQSYLSLPKALSILQLSGSLGKRSEIGKVPVST